MISISRRRFIAAAAALGASTAWARARPTRSRARWREQRDLYPEGVASGDPQPGQRDPVDAPAAPGAGNRKRSARGGRERRGLRARRRRRARASRWPNPTGPAACWSAACARRASTGIASPTSTAPAAASAARSPRPRDDDCAHRALRLRQLPERQPGRAERLPAHDLRGRARGARRAARLRAAPGRLHLRDRLVSGRSPARHVRPPPARRRALRATARRSPTSTFRRRSTTTAPSIARYLHDPDLQDARARWPFVVDVGQPRILAGWAGRACRSSTARRAPRRRARWRRTRPGSNTSRRGSPSPAARRSSASIRREVERRAHQALRRARAGQEPNNLAAIGSLTGYRALRFGRNVDLIITDQHSYRSEEPTDRPEAAPLASDDFPELLSRGGAADPRRRPHLRRRAPAGRHPLRRRARSRTSARTRRRRPSSAPSRRRGFSSACAGRGDLEDLGQLAGHARLARGSAAPAGGS